MHGHHEADVTGHNFVEIPVDRDLYSLLFFSIYVTGFIL